MPLYGFSASLAVLHLICVNKIPHLAKTYLALHTPKLSMLYSQHYKVMRRFTRWDMPVYVREISISQSFTRIKWSGRPGSNRGPRVPKTRALPGCATPRH